MPNINASQSCLKTKRKKLDFLCKNTSTTIFKMPATISNDTLQICTYDFCDKMAILPIGETICGFHFEIFIDSNAVNANANEFLPFQQN